MYVDMSLIASCRSKVLCKTATLKKNTNWFSRPSIAYCRSKVLQNAPGGVSTFIKLPFVSMIFVLSIFVVVFTQVVLYIHLQGVDDIRNYTCELLFPHTFHSSTNNQPHNYLSLTRTVTGIGPRKML